MSGQSLIIHKEPLPNPPRKRGGCHRRVGFFYYGYLLGHDMTMRSHPPAFKNALVFTQNLTLQQSFGDNQLQHNRQLVAE